MDDMFRLDRQGTDITPDAVEGFRNQREQEPVTDALGIPVFLDAVFVDARVGGFDGERIGDDDGRIQQAGLV